ARSPPPAPLPWGYMFHYRRGRGMLIYSLIPKGALPPLGFPLRAPSQSRLRRASSPRGRAKSWLLRGKLSAAHPLVSPAGSVGRWTRATGTQRPLCEPPLLGKPPYIAGGL